MGEAILKNIALEEVLSLSDQVRIMPGQIVSKTLVQNRQVSITLFAFAGGEEISSHESDGDAMVCVLEGTGKFTVDGTDFTVNAGETLIMPAGKPHAVYGQEAFKMMLTVVFPLS
ncbi:cupin domain-containing protein [Brucepastera parasyntrophica]|uniref:cupin domain-containing protein n=1 Tax=Brucepastera parasyntrophica TaxID=2880008 RepID=UPI00210E3764|nr:cupin domain-containing protein [Brucepastera parasyntrophica]ULQ60338.1 cupin domain-containing protein [Brucepastera parasyntrophica]